MTWALRLLVALVLVELIAAAMYLTASAGRLAPPLPDRRLVDPLTWVDLEGLAAEVQRYGDSQDWQRLAEALVGKGFYLHAELCYAESERLDPSNFMAALGVAYCLDRTGRMVASNVVYERLLPEATGEPRQQILYALGRNQLRLENADAAERWFAENRDFLPARNMFCSLLVETGRAELAAPIVADALAVLPQSLLFRQLQYKIARAADDTATMRTAADEAERAELLIPVNFSTDFLTAHNIEYGFNRLLQEYEQVAPSLLPAQRLAVLLDLQDRLENYQSPYSQLLQQMVAQAAADAGELSVLERQLEQFSRQQLHTDVTLMFQGDAARLRGQPHAAMEFWQRALQMQPSTELLDRLLAIADLLDDEAPVDRWRAARAFLQGKQAYLSRQPDAALPYLTEAVTLQPGDAQAWFYLAETERLRNNPAAAERAYQKCLAIDPHHPRAREWITRLKDAA